MVEIDELNLRDRLICIHEALSACSTYVCRDMVDLTSAGKVGILFGYCPQQDALDELLTGWEHLQYYCSLRGIPKQYIPEVSNLAVFREKGSIKGCWSINYGSKAVLSPQDKKSCQQMSSRKSFSNIKILLILYIENCVSERVLCKEISKKYVRLLCICTFSLFPVNVCRFPGLWLVVRNKYCKTRHKVFVELGSY